jgi:hypothetical protein
VGNWKDGRDGEGKGVRTLTFLLEGELALLLVGLVLATSPVLTTLFVLMSAPAALPEVGSVWELFGLAG